MDGKDGVVICDFDRERHAEALGRLDTSMASNYVYAVTGEECTLQLAPRSSTVPQRKSFPIALDEQPWTHGFAAVKGETLQGFIATAFEAWNRRLVVCHFYVDLHCRRQGVGRRLMEHALEHGRRQGALTAWVETSNLNYPGVEAYRRLGFSLCGFDATLYIGTPAEGEFALFMARPIGGDVASGSDKSRLNG